MEKDQYRVKLWTVIMRMLLMILLVTAGLSKVFSKSKILILLVVCNYVLVSFIGGRLLEEITFVMWKQKDWIFWWRKFIGREEFTVD